MMLKIYMYPQISSTDLYLCWIQEYPAVIDLADLTFFVIKFHNSWPWSKLFKQLFKKPTGFSRSGFSKILCFKALALRYQEKAAWGFQRRVSENPSHRTRKPLQEKPGASYERRLFLEKTPPPLHCLVFWYMRRYTWKSRLVYGRLPPGFFVRAEWVSEAEGQSHRCFFASFIKICLLVSEEMLF